MNASKTAEPRFVAVIDIGKTNVKLALHDLDAGTDAYVATTSNAVLAGDPYPRVDTEMIWRFLLQSLKACAERHPIDAISITTHGACAALIDEAGLVLPIIDYESPAPEALRADYDRIRPPFSETFSPRLPNGLNVGAQLFWQATVFPEAFARARHLLFYPQYWTWRLTGVVAGEVTSIACHTDLWMPAEGRVSSLATARGWDRLLPPMRSAFDAVGPLVPDLAASLGLSGREIPVHCGIHDSNASLLPHILSMASPFTVLSTGTWIIALAAGGALDRLDPDRDMLANVDALGRPIPSARFMGGREFDLLTQGEVAEPEGDDLHAVLGESITALPSFVAGTGPFGRAEGRWTVPPETLSPARRTAVASLYCACVTASMLDLIGAGGPTVVEGPFARNALFVDTVGALTGRPVIASTNATGTTAGAALLARGADSKRHRFEGAAGRTLVAAAPRSSAGLFRSLAIPRAARVLIGEGGAEQG